jgi:hypothetical protein
MKCWALVVVIAIGCHKKEAKTEATPSPTPADAMTIAVDARADLAVAPTIKPEDRAKQLIGTQVAALSKSNDDLIATFDKAAVVLVPDAREVKDPHIGLSDAINRTSPHESVGDIKVVKLAAGGNAGAMWLSAELDITQSGGEPGERAQTKTHRIRVTELATAEAGWRVVAAAFSQATKPMVQDSAPDPIPGATDAGPLAPLLAAAAQLDGALSSDPSVAVFGTDKSEAAFGPGEAHKLFATWNKLQLTLEGKPREVRGKTWGYVQANVDIATPKGSARIAGFLIAVPDDGGKWSVVAAQYTAI